MVDWPEHLEAMLMHILPQESYHEEVAIVATRTALMSLRRAIDDALESGFGAMAAMPSDGESYWLGLACVAASRMETIPLPYADPSARDGLQLPDEIVRGITERIRQVRGE